VIEKYLPIDQQFIPNDLQLNVEGDMYKVEDNINKNLPPST